jgi:hypothetical protein
MGYPERVKTLVAVEEAELEAEDERERDERGQERCGRKGGTHGFSVAVLRPDVKRPKET